MFDLGMISRTLGGKAALGRPAGSFGEMQARLREGLPYASLEALSEGFRISQDDLVRLLHLPPRTLARRKKERRLRSSESDRLFRVGMIAALAEETLGSRVKAGHWLHQRNRALGDETPLNLLDTDLGARQVEQVLMRIGHGVHS
ncbi:MAG: DUF2384 domain-containing protein [Deltaproteobacteria bacterium]|nr:DUF2384 domain-containing protein [Deltaproteobacteria bacterium]